MMSLIYVASALFLGWAITRRLGIRLFIFELVAISISLGLLLWTWTSFLWALILPYSLSLPLTVFTAAAAGFALWNGTKPMKLREVPGGNAFRAVWGTFTGLSTALIGWLMWTHDLFPWNGSLYSANSTWADFGLHASLISHFLAAGHLLLDFPIAAGTHLTYPFITDLLSSWLVRGGWDLHLAIFIPGLLLIFAFLQLMIGFGIRLFGSGGGAVAGLTLSLLSGTAVGAFTALSDFRASHLPLSSFLAHLPQDYTSLSTPNAQVINLIGDIILPQRTFLLGFAVFGTVLILFTHLRNHPTIKLSLFTGLLIGLLPLVHAHTFVVLMAIAGMFWIWEILKSRRFANNWLWMCLTAVAVALPQVAWQSWSNGSGTGGHLSLGWTIQPGENILSFWANNYGLTGLLIIGITTILIARRPLRQYLPWYLPFVAVFALANIYSIQPFAFDNGKLIMYVYIASYLFAGYAALWLIKRRPLVAVPIALVAIFIAASGVLAVMREFQHMDEFASADDISLAQWVKTSTQPTDVFVTTDKPNQPIATLGGRSIILGYRGWLYSFHINYQPRVDTVQQGLDGGLTQANPYGAKYLAVSAYEPADWTIDTTAMNSNYRQVYQNASWTVYRLP